RRATARRAGVRVLVRRRRAVPLRHDVPARPRQGLLLLSRRPGVPGVLPPAGAPRARQRRAVGGPGPRRALRPRGPQPAPHLRLTPTPLSPHFATSRGFTALWNIARIHRSLEHLLSAHFLTRCPGVMPWRCCTVRCKWAVLHSAVKVGRVAKCGETRGGGARVGGAWSGFRVWFDSSPRVRRAPCPAFVEFRRWSASPRCPTPTKESTMPTYLLLITTDTTVPASEEDHQGAPDVEAWAQRLVDAGRYVTGDPLVPAAQAQTVRVRGGKIHRTDGPFTE